MQIKAHHPLLLPNRLLIQEKSVKAEAINKELMSTAITTPKHVACTIQKVVSVFHNKKAKKLYAKTDLHFCNRFSTINKGTKEIKSKNGKPFTGQASERSNPESRANDKVRNIFCIIA